MISLFRPIEEGLLSGKERRAQLHQTITMKMIAKAETITTKTIKVMCFNDAKSFIFIWSNSQLKNE
jgi:hypothetical protein